MRCLDKAKIKFQVSVQFPIKSIVLAFSHQVIDGQVFPPSVVDAAVYMSYPPGVPPEHQMAIGQEVFGLLPGLGLYATLWLREHNRVCDVLKAEHPVWDDEQLFQTARLIIIGERDTVFREKKNIKEKIVSQKHHISSQAAFINFQF